MKTVFPLLVLLFGLSALPLPAAAQELNVDVKLDRSRISSTSLGYLDRLPEQIESYMNDHNWIDAGFRKQERIGALMQITLLSVDDNYNFQASVVIRSQRPIYRTLRRTTLFYFYDENWSFNHTPNRALVHDRLQFDSITTLLDYYAYIILGYDFDSFSEMGGTPYFSEAQNLVSLAQTASSTGWSRTRGNRNNRAQLAADLLNPAYSGFRQALYHYHREGLDRFLNSPETAREEVLEALEMIREAYRNTTNDLLFRIFFNAKYRELVALFEDAPATVRLKAYDVLSDIDQGHLGAYEKLR